jgi:hypothetical protein
MRSSTATMVNRPSHDGRGYEIEINIKALNEDGTHADQMYDYQRNTSTARSLEE